MTLTISVCIPCIEPHIQFLGRCIKSIYNQIHLPDEVIISLSNIMDKSFDLKDTRKAVECQIGQYRKGLNIIIFYTKERKYAGENRNKAIELSSGNIISLIDADDIMLPNRLYIIEKIFRYYPDCIGILHHFIENKDNIEDLEWNWNENDIKKYRYSDKLHFGHPSFRRDIFNEFKYSNTPRTQDFEFIDSILSKYLNNLYIYEQPLSCYYSRDSTLYNKTIHALSKMQV